MSNSFQSVFLSYVSQDAGAARWLRVAARSSAFTFKSEGATVAEVGRALNVGTVLEGSVRKSGTRMRIAVQLVKVADGWSGTR